MLLRAKLKSWRKEMFKNLKLAVKIGGGFAIVLILTGVIGRYIRYK